MIKAHRVTGTIRPKVPKVQWESGAAFPSLAREAEVSTDTARALGALAQEAEAYLHAARRMQPLPRRSFTGSNVGRELAASAARIRRNAAESDGRCEARRKP